jgi:hypothetical protein
MFSGSRAFVAILMSAAVMACGDARGDSTTASRYPPGVSSISVRCVCPGAVLTGDSGSFHLFGSLGQPLPVGTGVSASHCLSAGFWSLARPHLVTGLAALQPSSARLLASIPNPFNPATTIVFITARESEATIDIYDLRGERVRALLRAFVPAGPGSATWNGRDDAGRPAPSGLYFCRLRVGGSSDVGKLLLVR